MACTSGSIFRVYFFKDKRWGHTWFDSRIDVLLLYDFFPSMDWFTDQNLLLFQHVRHAVLPVCVWESHLLPSRVRFLLNAGSFAQLARLSICDKSSVDLLHDLQLSNHLKSTCSYYLQVLFEDDYQESIAQLRLLIAKLQSSKCSLGWERSQTHIESYLLSLHSFCIDEKCFRAVEQEIYSLMSEESTVSGLPSTVSVDKAILLDTTSPTSPAIYEGTSRCWGPGRYFATPSCRSH